MSKPNARERERRRAVRRVTEAVAAEIHASGGITAGEVGQVTAAVERYPACGNAVTAHAIAVAGGDVEMSRLIEHVHGDTLRRTAAALLGARGGAAGKGKAKRRSTSITAETAVELGAKGGAATGEAKRRSPEHYARMVEARRKRPAP